MIRSNLSLRPYQEIPDWDAFVEAHPKGSILHTTAMIRCEASTKRHEPFAYGAVDECGRVCALLVAIRVSTLDGFASTFASRSIMFAEPIYAASADGLAGVRELIDLHDRTMSRNCLFAEVRPLFDCPNSHDPFLESGYHRLGYLNYELRINRSEEELFQRLNEKRRNNVRSAIRKGVTVSEVDLKQGLKPFYQLVAESYSRSKVPIVDQTLFSAVAGEFCNSQVRLLIAHYQGKPVATGCFLAYKNRVICWYAGTHRIPGVYSMVMVFWEAIKQYAAEGYEILDLAGAGWEGEEYGPGKFKSKFGGDLTNHGRYRKVFAPLKLKAVESVYQVVRGWVAGSGNGNHQEQTANEVAPPTVPVSKEAP
jgi:serine/alanine adding enzyme